MTVPRERTIALKFAGKLLERLRDTSDLPFELRQEAVTILRHYPNADEINHIAIQIETANSRSEPLLAQTRQ
jgi:hypothetical protein